MTPLQDLIPVYIQSKTWFSVFIQREFLGHTWIKKCSSFAQILVLKICSPQEYIFLLRTQLPPWYSSFILDNRTLPCPHFVAVHNNQHWLCSLSLAVQVVEEVAEVSTVKSTTIQRRLAWPSRRDDTHKSRNGSEIFQRSGARPVIQVPWV